MRKIQDDQAVDHLRNVQRGLPCDHAAPIVADDDRLLFAQRLDDGDHVAHQQSHVVILDALGLVAQVVAALIDGDALEFIGQRLHLVAPRVPEIGKAVDHDDQRAAAEARVMNLDAVGIGITVFHAGFDVGRVHDCPQG